VTSREKAGESTLSLWTVAELGSFYAGNRTSFVAHAHRILKDASRAEEVVQDALIRVMLAAPELSSQEHALNYMHRTIENLCIDIFRLEGRRPNLVLIDDHSAEVEASWSNQIDHSELVAAADDAAIIRQALAMLSPAERAALVMWEVEGRSAKEIAAELGIKESAVRHTVSRGRASLRRILSEYVIDTERGLTALDLLSTTYKKMSEVAKKSSKAALSLILVFFAFLGFNSIPSDMNTPIPGNEESISLTSNSTTPTKLPAETTSKSTEITESASKNVLKSANTSIENAKASTLAFPGLDKQGIPTGFSVSDNTGALGNLYITNRQPILTETELSISQVAKTDSGAANIFLSQQLINDSRGLTYQATLSYGREGGWVPLVSTLTVFDSERLLSGNYLVTAILKVESEVDTPVVIPASASGRDLLQAPKQVITRLVLNPGKTQILSQAVYVVEKGAKS
jgi:RNA polymerase sigma factor (sigma-70 family)